MLDIVETKYGKFQSVRSNAGYALFRGIPYAKAPIGDRRFKAPEEPDKFEGVKVCDTYGPACVQFDRWADAIDDITDDSGHPYIHIEGYPYPPKMSEDCLYLNIYTPSKTGREKLPVMMYIHGGGCQQWYGSDYEYCGDHFAANGVILVSISYRLNVFGFYTHPQLRQESTYHASGNYGLLDQVAALKWIYENIENFGGDPENITVFGQSSGGRSTLSLLCSPLTKGMIRRVSIQSAGGLDRFLTAKSYADSEELGVEFMKMCGCKNIEEMRKLDANTLRDFNDRLGFHRGFNICTDGYVLSEEVDTCIREHLVPGNVDIIIGCTADEGANEKEPIFGVNMYEQIRKFCEVYRDVYGRDIYAYVFNQKQPGDDVGVPHSCDNRYQFVTLDGSWRPYTEEDYRLSNDMNLLWSNFAKCGNPGTVDGISWEPFNRKEEFLVFNGEGSHMY